MRYGVPLLQQQGSQIQIDIEIVQLYPVAWHMNILLWTYGHLCQTSAGKEEETQAMANLIPDLPPSLKPIKDYLVKGMQMQKLDPVVSHYCRVYACETGLQVRSNEVC